VLIVTSANGVAALAGRLALAGVGVGDFGHLKDCGGGIGDGAALEKLGLKVAVTPQEYVAESLWKALGEQADGKHVLLARAAVARDVIPDALRARGARVDVVDAYRTVIPAESVTAIRTLFDSGGRSPDAATFTSSSTVTNVLNLLRERGLRDRSRCGPCRLGRLRAGLCGKTLEPAAEAIRMICRGWWRR